VNARALDLFSLSLVSQSKAKKCSKMEKKMYESKQRMKDASKLKEGKS
jgi:hypothetical protein